MAELNIHLDVRVAPGLIRWGLGALLMTVVTGELASESVQLQTYYPAPSGVYTNMITTGNTWLSRDGGILAVGTNAASLGAGAKMAVMGGSVGIGTTSPVSTLEVNGNAQVDTNLTVGAPSGNLTVNGNGTIGGNLQVNGNGTVNQGLTVKGTAISAYGGSPAINANGANSAGGGIMLGGDGGFFDYNDGYITFNGNAGLRIAGSGGAGSGNSLLTVQGGEIIYNTANPPASTLSIGTGVAAPAGMVVGPMNAAASGYVVTGQLGIPTCSTVFYSFLISSGYANCPGGTYATMASGIYSQYFFVGNIAPSGQGDFMCCPYAAVAW